MAVSTQFRQELEALLLRYQLAQGSDTPEFLLTTYLVDCLAAFDGAVTAREQWYGRTTHAPATAPEGDGTL